MAQPTRATQAKRNRERAQKERAQEKLMDRGMRKEAKKERAAKIEAGVDPDLIGIVPGPQPPLEE